MSEPEAQRRPDHSQPVVADERPDDDASASAVRRAIAATLLPGFAGTTLPDWLAARLRDGLGGVCIFGGNIATREQLRELTDSIYAANPNAIIAIDEEGGDVTRLYYDSGSPYPGNAVLGRIGDLAYTEAVAEQVGWELRKVGCNVNFAPDVDINSNSDNPVIGVRSFGASADLVAAHSAAWTRGLQSTGVAVSAKHFPGHGDTSQDSHLALPVVDLPLDELRERELAPFRAVIAAGARTIMTSHILLPQLDPVHPATHSRIILQDLLRTELGFTGVIVSDALDMAGASGTVGIPEAAVLGLAAGCDLLCIGTDNTDEQLEQIETAVLAAIDAGRLKTSRVVLAASQVLELAAALADERAAIPIPDAVVLEGEPEFDLERIVAAFDVQPRSAGWVGAAAGRFQIVRIDTVANIAVGFAPWGPFAEVDARPKADDSVAFAQHPLAVVAQGAPAAKPELDAGLPVVVIGKDNHRHAFARDAIDAIRAQNPSVLVVDMGWPSDDRAYADVATFGASRLVGRSLIRYLTGSES
jgi:beta-N-acetylhexosaminidase